MRVVCARAYHALFMYNMLIRPTAEELASFGKPDFTIFNAGAFPVNRYMSYMSSSTSIDLNLKCGPARHPRLGLRLGGLTVKYLALVTGKQIGEQTLARPAAVQRL